MSWGTWKREGIHATRYSTRGHRNRPKSSSLMTTAICRVLTQNPFPHQGIQSAPCPRPPQWLSLTPVMLVRTELHNKPAGISCGHCANSSQISWLQTTHMNLFQVGGQMSEISFPELKLRYLPDALMLETPGDPFPCCFQLLEATCFHWLVAPPSIFKASLGVPSLLSDLCPVFILSPSDPPASLLKGPW